MELNKKDISNQVISMDKKYKTRDGRPVRVLCVDRAGSERYPVIGLLLEGDGCECSHNFTVNGAYFAGKVTDEDLIEVSPYEDFKVDDKVLVSTNGIDWYKRYFSHAYDGVVFAFISGQTSWSNIGQSFTEWQYCKKVEE